MMRNTGARILKKTGSVYHTVWTPAQWVEYSYFFVIFYSLLSGFLGVEVPLVAAGITVGLAGFCFVRLKSRAREVLAPIKLLLTCQISFILVQMVFYGVSPMDDAIRSFFLWICGMIVVQSLCLRQAFFFRCTVYLFLLGLVTVPHLAFTDMGVERAAVDMTVSGNLTNANGLAGWFGFCVVVFAITGFETQRVIGRVFYWVLATGSLFIVGLTVSRGALLGIAIALTIAFRRLLKRGFVPVLLLIIMTGLLFVTGFIDPIVSNYQQRGTEETGRGLIWVAVVERISTSPFLGVGIFNLATVVEGQEQVPHNSFLFFALTAGVVPLALWVAFWIRAGFSSSHLEQSPYTAYRIPLLLYALVNFLFGDITTAPWVLLSLSMGAGPAVSYQRGRALIPHRIQIRRTAPSLGSAVKSSDLE